MAHYLNPKMTRTFNQTTPNVIGTHTPRQEKPFNTYRSQSNKRKNARAREMVVWDTHPSHQIHVEVSETVHTSENKRTKPMSRSDHKNSRSSHNTIKKGGKKHDKRDNRMW